jgi:DNA-binding winged helix-turn-helix (wHTH) protein/predicted ATPase
MQKDQHLTFDRYSVDLQNAQLRRGKREIPLTSKAFAVLYYLVEHAGQLVTKAELFDALWPETAVTDGALTFCIVELRKALGDNAKAPRFIETLHKRGYRFLEKVVSSQHSVVNSGEETRGWRLETSSPSPQASSLKPLVSCLVGRETELTQLHHWLAKALNGERQIVFVTGESGIGKTTLIDAFLHSLASSVQRLASPAQTESQKSKVEDLAPSTQHLTPSLWLGRGQCIEQYGPGEPYMPILEALGRLCREPSGGQVVTLLQQHAPTWLVQMSSLLNPVQLEALQRTTQHATRERMLREMGEAIETITAARPVVLWLEDLHWSDASTLELLALLARRREPARLLVISTYRSVEVIVQEHPLRAVKQELQLHGLCAELPLGLLSETQVAEYLEQRCNIGATGRSPLQSVAKTIHRRTDGNPLFMVTAVEDLIAQKVLVQQAGHWAVHAELAAIATRVPDNLPQLIERQIERLSAADRSMLEVASVAGLEFSAASVAAGLAIEVESVEARCEGLAQHGHFLRASDAAEGPDDTVTASYIFLHTLYQEVLYALIPAGRRRRLHQQIGEQQEAAYGKRAREIAAALAVHFEQGRDYGKAVQYLQQAGENAVRRSAHQETIIHLTKALELLTTLPDTAERDQQEVRLQIALGTSLMATKGFAAPEIEHAYARVLVLCQQREETPRLFPALGGLCAFYLERAELQTAHELAEQMLAIATRAQDRALLLWAHLALGASRFFRGELMRSRLHFEESLAFNRPRQQRSYGFVSDPGVHCLSYLVYVLWWLGYPDEALKCSREALSLARKLSHPFSLAYALVPATAISLRCGKLHAAQELAESGVTLCTEEGFARLLAASIIMRGWTLVEQGQEEEGITQMCQGLAGFRATGSELGRTYYLTLMAESCGKVGQIEDGLRALAEALAIVDQTGECVYEAELYRLKGELLLAQESKKQKAKGRRQKKFSVVSSQLSVPSIHPPTPSTQGEAEACFLKAIEVSQKQQAKSLELRASISLARLWQQQGKRTEAHRMLSEVYNWFTEGFDTKDLQEAKALLDELSH